MFQHILVPVDFTPKNRKALDAAAQIAVANGSRVTLLHVIEIIENIPFAELKNFYKRLEKAAQKKLGAFTKIFGKKGVVVEKKITFGKRVDEIIKASSSQGVDLVVLNSHKIKLGKLGKDWGTLSYKVSVLSRCPVLLVK